MKAQEKIFVKTICTNNWYKKGEIHEVGNYVTFDYCGNDPCFEKSGGSHGINVSDCEIFESNPLPQYTMDDLIKKVGHEFILKK